MNKSKTSSLAIKNIRWMLLDTPLQKIWLFVVNIILARLLTPNDFGLLALAFVTVSIVNTLKNYGLNTAFIQRKNNQEEAANVLFYFNFFFSIFIYIILYSVSPYISTFFSSDMACPIIRLLGLQIIIQAFSVVHRNLSVRELAAKEQTVALITNTIVSGVISIVFALKGYGVWALVYGPISGTLFSTVLWWYLIRWKPVFSFNWKIFKELLNFSISISLTNMLITILSIIDKVLIGKFMSIASLGIYDFSKRIIQWPVLDAAMFNRRVVLPAFCKEQDNIRQLKEWFLKLIGMVCFFILPTTLWLSILADSFVSSVYGMKWIQAVPIIRILSLTTFIIILDNSTENIYLSLGKTILFLKINLSRLIVSIFVLLYTVQISLIAVCIGQLGLVLVFGIVNLYISMRIVGITLHEFIHRNGVSIANGFIYGVIVFLSKIYFIYIGELAGISLFLMTTVLSLLFYILFLSKINPNILGIIKNAVNILMDNTKGIESKV